MKKKSFTVEFIKDVKNLKSYKFLTKTNRKPNEQHIKTIMASFDEFGASGATIIVIRTQAFNKKGKWELYVADGQHRIIAAERLGVTLDVKVIQLVDDSALNVTKYVSMLNNNAKAWSTINFLDAYVDNNVKEYKTFKMLKNKFKLTITDLLFIYLGNGGAKENRAFKSGTMVFDDAKSSLELAKMVAKIKPFIPNKAFCRRSLYRVMQNTSSKQELTKAIINAANLNVPFSENEKEFYNQLIGINNMVEIKLKKAA